VAEASGDVFARHFCGDRWLAGRTAGLRDRSVSPASRDSALTESCEAKRILPGNR
jgi:hypothetical protein